MALNMPRTSIYRSFTDRLPQNDVHCVERHALKLETLEQELAEMPREDWTDRRKARPADHLLPATLAWLAKLPLEIQPNATREGFPRIVNLLALLWSRPEALTSYLDELVVDRRGGRRGFPLTVLQELRALGDYQATLRPSPSNPGR
jgi:hypothetical protein